MEGIPSARVSLFVIPRRQGAQPIAVGFVEQFTATKRYAVEVINELGQGPGVDTIPNNENGMVGWGRVVKFADQNLLNETRQRISEWNNFNPFNLLAVDPETGKPIALAVGVAPESIDLQTQNGRAMRENYRGVCQKVLLGDEISQAANAQAA
jgi:hypothetical protein